MVDSACLWWAARLLSAAESTEWTATAAEELGEKILGVHATSHSWATILKSSLAILVVNLALLRVGKDLVCVRNLLELFGRGWVVCVLIWCC